jgi:hypothetical protein
MITIYSSPENTQRLEFVAGHLFGNTLGTEHRITSDATSYRTQTGPCLNYSNQAIDHGLQIIPHGLLSESGVRHHPSLQTADWNGLFCLFHSGQGDIPFDLFAATFYLLSLYEEYLPSPPDEHGRFDHRHSLLFRNGWLETPVIDRWAYQIKAALEKAGFPTNDFQLRKYRAVDTCDIDHPYLYRYKGIIKNTAACLRDLSNWNLQAIGNRLSVLLLQQEDPYLEALHRILAVQSQSQNPSYLFVLLGKRSKHGHASAHTPKAYYRYLRTLSNPSIGLHPSYETLPTDTSPDTGYQRLRDEKQQLEKIMQQPIHHSRQHFLRMQTPATFQALLQAGIREDFTLAFAKAPGFRSGTAIPHLFYDLRKETKTNLLLHPTVMMDSTLIFHLKLTPEAALQRMKTLINACRQSGGDYLNLWHNSNLAGTDEENPWIRVFIESHRYATNEP